MASSQFQHIISTVYICDPLNKWHMYHFSSICRMEMDHFSSTHWMRYKQPHIIFIWVSFATLLHHLEILFLKLCVHYVWQQCNNLGAQEMITKLVLNTSIFMFLKFLNVTNSNILSLICRYNTESILNKSIIRFQSSQCHNFQYPIIDL